MATTYQLMKKSYGDNSGPEYGFGDYPNVTWTVVAEVEADTMRSAQAKAKKLFPAARFSGQFASWRLWEKR